MRPVEPGAGEKPHAAAIEGRMHAVAVEFDFVQPGVAFRRRVDQLRELRRDPLRQGGGAWTRYRPRHAGSGNDLLRRRMRLLEVIDLADMLGGMREAGCLWDAASGSARAVDAVEATRLPHCHPLQAVPSCYPL
jgi:hypothetical protein